MEKWTDYIINPEDSSKWDHTDPLWLSSLDEKDMYVVPGTLVLSFWNDTIEVYKNVSYNEALASAITSRCFIWIPESVLPGNFVEASAMDFTCDICTPIVQSAETSNSNPDKLTR